MPDIIQQIRDAYSENPAAALKLIPELIKQYENGLIVVLPCNAGDTVYTIKESYFDCENCQYGNEAHYDKEIGRVCCDRENQHCPYVISEHIPEGFEVSKNKNKKWELSLPGEWGYEGLEQFSGINGKCYFTRSEAEVALKEREP